MNMNLAQRLQASAIYETAIEEIQTAIRTAAGQLTGMPLENPSSTTNTVDYYQACIQEAHRAGWDVRRWVAEARSHEVSWSDIGRVLGVTGEAARHRFPGLSGAEQHV